MIKSILEALGIKKKTKYPIRFETFGYMEKAPEGVVTMNQAYGTVTYIYKNGAKRTYNKVMEPYDNTLILNREVV